MPSALSAGFRHMAWSAFWFSLMSLLVKYAGQRIPAMQIVLVRAAITLVLSWVLLRRARIPVLGTRRRLLVLRGVFGLLGLTCFYAALVHLPLAEATVIHYTNPVFTAVVAAVVLREAIGWRLGACVLASLTGVVLIARPAALLGEGVPVAGGGWVGVALLAAIFSAFAYVTVRKLGRSEHPLVVVFYFPLVTVPLVLPIVVPLWIPPTPWEWAALAGVGVTTQIAQVHLTRGLALEPAGRAMSVGYLQVVLAGIWGWALFGETLDRWSVAGIVTILGSTLAVARLSRRAAAPPEQGRAVTAPGTAPGSRQGALPPG